jgi:hypothetical protein
VESLELLKIHTDLNDHETVNDIIFNPEIEYDFPEKYYPKKQLSKIIKRSLK